MCSFCSSQTRVRKVICSSRLQSHGWYSFSFGMVEAAGSFRRFSQVELGRELLSSPGNWAAWNTDLTPVSNSTCQGMEQGYKQLYLIYAVAKEQMFMNNNHEVLQNLMDKVETLCFCRKTLAWESWMHDHFMWKCKFGGKMLLEMETDIPQLSD